MGWGSLVIVLTVILVALAFLRATMAGAGMLRGSPEIKVSSPPVLCFAHNVALIWVLLSLVR